MRYVKDAKFLTFLPGSDLHKGEALARFPNKLLYDPHGFFPSDFKEGVETLRGEDIDGDDAAKVAPVVAVGGGPHAGVVVEEVLAGE